MSLSPNLSVYVTSPDSKSDSRDEKIVRELLQAIIDRRLRPGARLPEDSLGEAFKVSRTTIRKAEYECLGRNAAHQHDCCSTNVLIPGPSLAAQRFDGRRFEAGP